MWQAMNLVGQVLIAIGALTVFLLGLGTFLPVRRRTPKVCFVGYQALCPMAPFSSILTFAFGVFLVWYGFVLS